MDPNQEPAKFRRAGELPLPGSIGSPPRVVYRAVVALGESLSRAGFRTVMVTNAPRRPAPRGRARGAWPTSRRWSRGGHSAAESRSIASDPPFIQPNFWRWLAAGGGVAALALRALL